jgi:hypothetical protein
MPSIACDVMTADPACGTTNSTLDRAAKRMVDSCGEIPILDVIIQPVGSCAKCPEISAANSVDGR